MPHPPQCVLTGMPSPGTDSLEGLLHMGQNSAGSKMTTPDTTLKSGFSGLYELDMMWRHHLLLQRGLFWKTHSTEMHLPDGQVQTLVKDRSPSTTCTKAAGPDRRCTGTLLSQPHCSPGCRIPQSCFLQAEVSEVFFLALLIACLHPPCSASLIFETLSFSF